MYMMLTSSSSVGLKKMADKFTIVFPENILNSLDIPEVNDFLGTAKYIQAVFNSTDTT